MTICERIFGLLAESGRGQRDLAVYIGAPMSTVGSWKKNGSNPGAEYIPRIAEFLNVSTDYLLTGENKEYRLDSESQELLDLWDSLSKADKAAINEKETKDAAAAHHAQVALDEAKKTAAFLQGKTVTVHAKAGENGKLFGKITSKEIADAVSREYSVPVSKKKVELSADIKAQGEFTFEVKLHAGVTASMKVIVTA